MTSWSRSALVVATLGIASVAAAQPAAPADGISRPASLAFQNTTTINIAEGGAATPYPLTTTISGFSGKIGRLTVQLDGVTHARLEDLDILLVAPNGFRTLLLSDIPGSVVDASIWLYPGPQGVGPILGGVAMSPSNIGNDDTFPPPASPGPYGTALDFVDGYDANGTWTLYVTDDSPGVGGSIGGFTLFIDPRFDDLALQAIPPSGSTGTTVSTIDVSGINRPIVYPEVSVFIGHAAVSQLSLSLQGPDGTIVPLVAQGEASGANFGTSCDHPTTFAAQGTTIPNGTGPYAGVFKATGDLFAFDGKTGSAVNGPWMLRISDMTAGTSGALACWSLKFNTKTINAAPTQLTATSIIGNELSLRWISTRNWLSGQQPTGFIVEGGVNPGETLAQFPVGLSSGLTLTAPTGAFYVRVRAVYSAGISEPSNEIRVFVNTPTPPSPPDNLRIAQNGASLDLAWTNTFAGGTPTELVLDVTGSASAAIPIPFGDAVSFTGAPAGNYVVRLRAVNAAGSSAATPGVAIGIPSPSCTGAPPVPIRLVAYAVGRTIYASWEQPKVGSAATSYVITSTGALNGDVPITGRRVSATVGPGDYVLTVRAVNQCGTSAASSYSSVRVQ